MLIQEKEIIFFKIVYALEELYKTHVLEPIQNAIKIWDNYELHFIAELCEDNFISEIVKIAEDIANKRQPKTNRIKTDTIFVAKMNKDNFFVFPEGNDSNDQLREKYYFFRDCRNNLDINIEEIQDIEEHNTLKNKMQIQFEELKILFFDKIHQNNEPTVSPSIEMNPSMFYYINEQVVELLLGGMWKEAKSCLFDILATYEDDEIVHDMLSGQFFFDFDDCYDGQKYWETIFRMENIKLYVDAVYISSTSSSTSSLPPERIVQITRPYFSNLINYNLRGFHDGKNYCPLGMSELIPQFIFPITVREAIEQSVEIIESQEYFVKEAVIKAFLNKFNEKEYFYEASIIEYLYQIYLTNTNMPIFFNKLNNNQKAQYRQIQQLNSSLHPPLTDKEQENSDYSKYFLLYFSFVNTIISSIFGDRITISDFKINSDYYNDILKSRIEISDFNEITRYRNREYKKSDKRNRYLDLFNDIKHPVKVNIDYGMISIFNKDTEKVLGIILKYKK